MRHLSSDRVGVAMVVVVAGAFVAGLAVISTFLPNPPDGPTPPGTRVADYALVASCCVALAAIPLGMWLVDRRAGKRPALAWRVVTVAGVALAMLLVSFGVQAWAYPPHNLRQCFIDHRGDGRSGVWGHICERGLLNRPLGLRRLNEALAGALVVLVVTAAAAVRLVRPPAGIDADATPARRSA